jgi:hypothetical protein
MQNKPITLSKINKKQAFICFLIAIGLNGYWFFSKWKDHEIYKNQGVETTLYVKSLEGDEVTFFEKLKYTSVAKTFYIVANGDTIFNRSKNSWKTQFEILSSTKVFLPLDQVVYDKKHPENSQLISEFRTYSIVYQAVSYFGVGPIFVTIFLYLLFTFIKTARLKLNR